MPLARMGVAGAGRGLPPRRVERRAPLPDPVVDDDGTDHRIAVNVKSAAVALGAALPRRRRLLHPVTTAVGGLDSSWHPCPRAPGGPNLDYIRANLSKRRRCGCCRPTRRVPTTTSQICWITTCSGPIADPAARLDSFGQRWGPEAAVQDKVFGFRPGNGVHDIHMNQGKTARSLATTACGRTAVCFCTSRLSPAGWASSSPSRARPGTPTTAPVTPPAAWRPRPRPTRGH